MAPIEEVGIEEICSKCKRKISEHPSTGRFHTIILYGPECAWDPDDEVKGFVADTLKFSGYDLENFGLKNEHEPTLEVWNMTFVENGKGIGVLECIIIFRT